MKALRIIGIVLLILVAAFLIVALFLPKSAATVRTQAINAPAELIFEQVYDLRNWEAWSPFAAADEAMLINYGEIERGVGASYSWTGDMGSGVLTVSDAVEHSRMDYDILFDGKREAKGQWLLEETEEGVILTWTFEVPSLDYPLGRYYGLFLEAGMDPFMVSGLNKIKEIAESETQLPSSILSEITLEELGPLPILAIRDSVTIDEMHSFYANAYDALEAYVLQNQVSLSGPAMSVALTWNEGGTSLLEAAMPLTEMIKVSENEASVYARVLPGGTMAVITHYGPYESLGTAYEALEAYMADYSLMPAGAPFEVYIIDPESETDAAKWETKIHWPVMPAE